MASPLRSYPRKAEIERMVQAVKACGIDVAGVEVSPNGTIKMVEARAIEPDDEFSRWKDRV